MPARDQAPDRQRWVVETVVHLVEREFRLRYRRAYLGSLWALGQPLARLFVLTFVFSRVLQLDIPDYGTFLFIGILGWTWFAAGVSSITSCAIDRRDLLVRPLLPRPAIPVVSVLTDALDLLVALPVLAVFMLFQGGIPPTSLALPLLLLVQLLLTLGIGCALCAANVFFRDVRLFVDVSLLLGFYLTPVFYDVETVPEQYRFVFDLNPMSHLLEAYREVLIAGQLPSTGTTAVLVAVSVTVFVVGLRIFEATSHAFLDEL